MRWLLFTVLGVVLNCVGLDLFADAVMHRTVEAGAAAAGIGDLILSLALINAGILLMIEGRRPRR
jgi:Co/Zn/Cd efflux system component